MKLIWSNNGGGYVERDGKRMPLAVSPTLPFAFDALYYDPDAGRSHKAIGGGMCELNNTENAAVANLIQTAIIQPATNTPTLAQAQAEAAAAIDEQAGSTRAKYITDVPGQAETYLLKANDAEAYKAAGYPAASIASYPMVDAEAKALYGATPTAVQYQAAADSIITTRAQWLGLAGLIEQQRRGGKIAVAAATTIAAVQPARNAAIAALRAL